MCSAIRAKFIHYLVADGEGVGVALGEGLLLEVTVGLGEGVGLCELVALGLGETNSDPDGVGLGEACCCFTDRANNGSFGIQMLNPDAGTSSSRFASLITFKS